MSYVGRNSRIEIIQLCGVFEIRIVGGGLLGGGNPRCRQVSLVCFVEGVSCVVLTHGLVKFEPHTKLSIAYFTSYLELL